MMRSLLLLILFTFSLTSNATIYPIKFECIADGQVVYSIGKNAQGLANGEPFFWMNSELNSLFPQEVSFGRITEMRSPRTPSGPDRLDNYLTPLYIKGIVQNYGYKNVSQIFVKADIDFNNEVVTLIYNPIYHNNPKHPGYRFTTQCDLFTFEYL